MTILKLRIYPDPVLKERSLEVDTFGASLAKLLDNMAETMYLENGVGLAAPQIGQLQRITVVDVSRECNQIQEFINPVIISADGSTTGEEGCLSIPEYRDTVTRAETIEVEYQDRHGKKQSLKADGLLARCLQHEIDHLDGILFVDRLSRLKREYFKKWLKKQASGEV